MTLFQNLSNQFSRICRLKLFSIYSPSGHFVQQSGTIGAILLECYTRNISVKIFQNLLIGLAEEVVYFFFLFIALAAILFNGAEPFEQFW